MNSSSPEPCPQPATFGTRRGDQVRLQRFVCREVEAETPERILMKPFFVFLILLDRPRSAEPKYDPAKLPKGHDYFELRDGLANCQRKFTQREDRARRFLRRFDHGGRWRGVQHAMRLLRRRSSRTRSSSSSMRASAPWVRCRMRSVWSAMCWPKGRWILLFVEAAVNDSSNIPAASRSHAARHGGRGAPHARP